MSDTPSLPPGTLLADKFRIERLLGAGAMGEVYAIRHELTRHRRALKLLHPSARLVPEIVRRFLDEASAAGRAGNPHLVETFDAGTLPSGEPYVVMELLEGETLGTILERQSTLSVSDAANWVSQAAEGIAAAHQAGIIHRDLKPDNLFLTQRDSQPFVKILDFGVSKFATESGSMSHTRAGVMYGSPAYMSPEQLMGSADVDARTDVFALGVVLYQCLAGQLPFDGPTIEALAVRVLTGVSTPLESVRPDLPPALVAVVSRALSTQPALRFPSAVALADALGPFYSRRPSRSSELSLDVAPHPSQPVLGQSLAAPPPRSRQRVAVWIAAVLLLAVVLGALLQRSARGLAEPVSERALPAGVLAEAKPTAAQVTVAPLVATTAALEVTPPRAREGSAPMSAPERSARTASPHASALASVAAPPAASARSSAADDLGLQQTNPFR